MDDCTPREVWLEYEARKRALDGALTHGISELYRRRDALVERIAQSLGCGVPAHLLTSAQRLAQECALRRWRETEDCAG